MNYWVLLIPIGILAVMVYVAVIIIRAFFHGVGHVVGKVAEAAEDRRRSGSRGRSRSRSRTRSRREPRERRDDIVDAIEEDTRRNWTCSECGKRNHANADECRGCGADQDVEWLEVDDDHEDDWDDDDWFEDD